MNGLHISAEALLITNPLHITYLAEFTGVTPTEREAIVLVSKTKIILFLSALYTEMGKTIPAQSPRFNLPIHIEPLRRFSALGERIADIAQEEQWQTLGFESHDLTMYEYAQLQKGSKNIKYIPLDETLESQRAYKDAQELIYIRQAAAITDNCFSAIQAEIKTGITEQELAWSIETYFHKHAAQSAFPPIVAFGTHTSMPHYDGKENAILQKNDTILLDFGAKVQGYCADMTRMMCVGKPNPIWQKAYETLLNAQEAALHYLQQIKIDRSGAAVDSLVRKQMALHDYPPCPHSLGHGVGLAIHEAPRLSMMLDEKLQPGMVITIEPGIYIENDYGIRIEDLVYITADGMEILSHAEKNPYR